MHAYYKHSLVQEYAEVKEWFEAFLEKVSGDLKTEAEQRTKHWPEGVAFRFMITLFAHLAGCRSHWRAEAMRRGMELESQSKQEHNRSEQIVPKGPTVTVSENPRRAFVLPILAGKGWSILDWANESEVSHATAADYLDEKSNPYSSTRLKLAKALGITVEQLPK